MWFPGDRVMVTSLVEAVHLNGKKGLVLKPEEGGERVLVKLNDGEEILLSEYTERVGVGSECDAPKPAYKVNASRKLKDMSVSSLGTPRGPDVGPLVLAEAGEKLQLQPVEQPWYSDPMVAGGNSREIYIAPLPLATSRVYEDSPGHEEGYTMPYSSSPPHRPDAAANAHVRKGPRVLASGHVATSAEDQEPTSRSEMTKSSTESLTPHMLPRVAVDVDDTSPSVLHPRGIMPAHAKNSAIGQDSPWMAGQRHVWSSQVAGIHAVVTRVAGGQEQQRTLLRTERLQEKTILESFGTEGQLWRKGILPGDELVAVDGKRVDMMDLKHLQAFIEGEEGTPVVLDVIAHEAQETRRVTIIRSRSTTVDAVITAYQDVLNMMQDQGVELLKEAPSILYHMHRRVCNEVLELKDRCNSNSLAEKDQEIQKLRHLLQEAHAESARESERLLTIASEERNKLRTEISDLHAMLRNMADEFDQAIKGYVKMEKEAISYVSLHLNMPFEQARDDSEVFQQDLRQEVAQALNTSRNRVDVVSMHRATDGRSTIAIIELVPLAQGTDERSSHSLARDLCRQACDESSPVFVGVIAKTIQNATLVTPMEVSKGHGDFRKMLGVLTADNDALRAELDAAEIKNQAHQDHIQSLSGMEQEWQRAEERLRQVLGQVGMESTKIRELEMTRESLTRDLEMQKQIADQERKTHAAEKEQLLSALHQVEADSVSAHGRAATRESQISFLERKLMVECGESEGLRVRLEEIQRLADQVDHLQERDAKHQSVVSHLQNQNQDLKEELDRVANKAQSLVDESITFKDVAHGNQKSAAKLELLQEANMRQFKDIAKQLDESEARYEEISEVLKKVSNRLLHENDDGKSKTALENLLRAQKSRNDSLVQELARASRDMQDARQKLADHNNIALTDIERQASKQGLKGKATEVSLSKKVIEDQQGKLDAQDQQLKALHLSISDLQATLAGKDLEETHVLLSQIKKLLYNDATLKMTRSDSKRNLGDEQGSSVDHIMIEAQVKEIERLQSKLIALGS